MTVAMRVVFVREPRRKVHNRGSETSSLLLLGLRARRYLLQLGTRSSEAY